MLKPVGSKDKLSILASIERTQAGKLLLEVLDEELEEIKDRLLDAPEALQEQFRGRGKEVRELLGLLRGAEAAAERHK